MNTAIIFAGGSGQRMNTNGIPKQFLQVFGKPILIWTLEKFQDSKVIDDIILVILEDYLEEAKELIKRYHITKVVDVILGGSTGQESIYKGISRAKEIYSEDSKDSIVFIHDGVRPFITEELIESCLDSVVKNGSAIAVSPAIETIVQLSDNKQIQNVYDRSSCYHAKAPQCFYLDDLYSAHLKAIEENNYSFIDSASIMSHYGYNIYTVLTNSDNIKITTSKDYYFMKALIQAYENMQILGI